MDSDKESDIQRNLENETEESRQVLNTAFVKATPSSTWF